MPALSIIAALTETGRAKIADMTISGRGFQVQKFVIGRGGHDPGNPAVALTPDPQAVTLPDQTFGPKLVVFPTPQFSGILVTPFCPQFTALLDYTEANGFVSSVGLIARIVSSPILADPLIGTEFLFAYGNRPLIVKTDADQFQIDIQLQT
jgi:hypothetical protein